MRQLAACLRAVGKTLTFPHGRHRSRHACRTDNTIGSTEIDSVSGVGRTVLTPVTHRVRMGAAPGLRLHGHSF
jgi:hypothetical protein